MLDGLSGTLDEARMQQLNHEIDAKQRRPEDVAREVLDGWFLGRTDHSSGDDRDAQ